MGAFSTAHLLLVLAIALIFLGPGRLPDLGKSLGEAIRGFKEGINDDNEEKKRISQAKRNSDEDPKS